MDVAILLVAALVIALVVVICICFKTAIALAVAMYKGFRTTLALVTALAVAIYKGFRTTLALVTALAVAIYKGFRTTLALVVALAVAIYKGFKMTVIAIACICKFFKKGVTTILCVTTNCAQRNDPGNSPTHSTEDIETANVVLEFGESQVGCLSMENFLTTMAREKPIRFSTGQLTQITRNYSIKLGSGGFGNVYKGELEDRVKVAVKVLKRDSDKRVQEQFMAEVATIGRTYHVNLVKLYGFCFTPTTTALIYEYMENGSLEKFLFDQQRLTDWGKLHDIAIGTAKAIAYLHEGCQPGIIHYDIKPENVLLDTNLNPKVADFGLAKLCNIESSLVSLTGYRGTPGYAAPELWMPFPVTRKCDVYSFGILLFEIVGRRKNFDRDTQEWTPRQAWDMFANGKLREMVSLFGIEEREREKAERMCMVALWCVQYVAESRPTMSTVVTMLEGVAEIPPPPNPFEHLDSNAPNAFASGINFSDSMPLSSRTAQSNCTPSPEFAFGSTKDIPI